MPGSKPHILLSGMIAGDPYQGGATWAVLQYLLGFKRLGHEITFVEPVKPSSLQPAGTTLAQSATADYFRQVTDRFGLQNEAALLAAGTHETVGLPYDEVRRRCRRADILINISGMLTDEDLTRSIPFRVYLDLDPAFNQLWHAVQGIDMRFAGHTAFVTVGLAIGSSECTVPTCGLSWIATLQPIVLEHWPVGEEILHPALTTVGNWRGYGSIMFEGQLYGQKANSFRRFITLPKLTKAKFMPALAIHADEVNDLAALADNGWQLLDPKTVADTPDRYAQFVRGSWAELGIAKSGYVVSRCGWFSDRSICYLASGRPVLAQDTGFRTFLPTGKGLLSFAMIDEAVAGIEELRGNYEAHSQAARSLAEEYFDSDKVLTRLLRVIGADS